MKTSFKKIVGLATSALLLTGGLFSLNIDMAQAATKAVLVTFEANDTTPGLKSVPDAFSGSTGDIVSDAPANGPASSLKSLKIVKGPGGDPWSGVNVLDEVEGRNLVPSTNKIATAWVYAPAVGSNFMLKATGGGAAVAASATTTVLGWQEMTFDFGSPADGTSYDANAMYSGLTVFADFPNNVARTGEIWYLDNISFAHSTSTTPVVVPVDPILANFEADDTSGYLLGIKDTVDIDSGVSSLSSDAPLGGSEGSTKSAKYILGSACYSGAVFLQGDKQLTSKDNKIITLNVWAPAANKIIGMKLENKAKNKFVQVLVNTTRAGWNHMTFDMSTGYDNSAVYTRLLFMPGFTCDTAFTHVTGETYYFDDVAFNGAVTPDVAAVPDAVVANFETGDTSGYKVGAAQDAGGNVSSISSAAPTYGSPDSAAALKIVVGSECNASTLLIDGSKQLTSIFNKVVTMNVYAPAAGKVINLMLTPASDAVSGSPVDVSVTTTRAGWQTMSFDLSDGYDSAAPYTTARISADYTCNSGTHATGAVYYFDDIAFNGAATPEIIREARFTPTLVNFEPSDNSGYASGDFEEARTTVVTDAPANGSLGSTRALKIVNSTKCASGSVFLVGSDGLRLASAANKVVTMNVWAPAVGKTILFKLEGPAGAVVQASVLTTKIGWQKMSFDLSTGFNPDSTYLSAVIFADFTCANSAAKTADTYYIDDIAFNGAVTAALDIPVVKAVTLAATSTVKGKVYVTVKNANGKAIKVVVAGGSTVKKTANSDNYVIKITTKKGSHKVTVTVGSKKLVKTLKVK